MLSYFFSNSHFSSPEKFRFLRDNFRSIFIWPLACLILVVMLWGQILTRLDNEKRVLEAAAARDAETLSKAYADYLNRIIEQLDQLSHYVKYEWETTDGAFRLEELRRNGLFGSKYSAAITIFDQDGKALTSTYPITRQFLVTDLPYFKFHQNNDSDDLRIEQPFMGRVSERIIAPVTRRLNNADGSFDGVVVVSVDPEFFFLVTGNRILGEEGLWALADKHGGIRLTRLGGTGVQINDQLLLGLPSKKEGVLLAGGSWFRDSKPRYIAAKPLDNYPFLAIVGIPRHTVLMQHERNYILHRNVGISISILLLLFAAASMFLAIQAARKKHRVNVMRNSYRMATEHSDEGFYLWEAIYNRQGGIIDFEIIDCNERGAELIGTTRQLVVSTRLSSYIEKNPHFQTGMHDYLAAMGAGVFEDEQEVPPEMGLKTTWLHRRMVRSEAGLAVTLRDISDQKAHKSELAHLATHDPLTGLPNRHWLMTHLDKALESAKVNQVQLALLCINVDDFKNVNDLLGRTVGDQLLQAIATCLKSGLRDEDNIARLGEDEFAVILSATGSPAEIAVLANRILHTLHAPFEFLQRKKPVGVSIGISISSNDGNDAEALLKNAEIAMYSAKVECRGSFRFYEHALYDQIKQRLDTEQELLRAVEEDHFVLYYQPRVNTVSGQLVGMEALVRWIHPERGLIPPNDFIPLAESTGIVLALGALVMDKACAQLAAWQRQGLPVVPISVNVSARQFDEGGVKELIAANLAKHDIVPGLIEVELTESAMMGDFETVQNEVNAINALGVKIHIDDFGTGYSSLSLLHNLNLNVLKVDRAFTSQLGNGKGGEVFFTAIVSMAKALGMSVVAEGVETAEQLHALQTMECDEIQGYFISRPLPAQDVPALMQKRMLFPEAG
jgi:diguanylate cyclase (GGDEF)-like protein